MLGLDQKIRLTQEEQSYVNEVALKRRLLLQVRTTTDVDWCTINTADGGETRDKENAARRKLKDLWYNGLCSQHPPGTEWRIANGFF